MRKAKIIVLSQDDQSELERRIRSQKIEKRLSERARIISLLFMASLAFFRNGCCINIVSKTDESIVWDRWYVIENV